MREPALPVDPRLPDEPTVLEVGRARVWLAKRGVMVWLPTRLLALRLGGRALGGQGVPTFAIVIAFVWMLIVSVGQTVDLPGRGLASVVFFAVFQLLRWRRAQRREQVAERLAGAGAPLPFRVAAKQVGWWYLASVAVTFVGGAALCAASFLTGPQFTWRLWYPPAVEIGMQTFALAFGAGATALVLGRALRAPVIAEDGTSRLVDELLRAEDPHRFAPTVVYALPAMPVVVVDWLSPGPLGWLALAYLGIVAGLQLTGWLLTRRRFRRLPPGYYGR